MAYSRFLSGLYKVSSGDQSMRRVGNLKYICMYVCIYVCMYVLQQWGQTQSTATVNFTW